MGDAGLVMLFLPYKVIRNFSISSLSLPIHCVSKKLHLFYFCNNSVDPGPIWIIFGRYVANEFSSGLQGLWYHAGLRVSDTDT